MTPKEKANELIESHQMRCIECDGYRNAIIHSILTVNEIINSSPSLPILGDGGTFGEDIELSINYWKSVKRELELL
jgi:hypothetical protein